MSYLCSGNKDERLRMERYLQGLLPEFQNVNPNY